MEIAGRAVLRRVEIGMRIDPNNALRTFHTSDAGDHPDGHGVIAPEYNREGIFTHDAFKGVGYRAAGGQDRLDVLWMTRTSRPVVCRGRNFDISEVVNGVAECLHLLGNAGGAKDLRAKSRTAPASAELEWDSDECCSARSPYSEKE